MFVKGIFYHEAMKLKDKATPLIHSLRGNFNSDEPNSLKLN